MHNVQHMQWNSRSTPKTGTKKFEVRPLGTEHRTFPGRCVIKEWVAHCSFQVVEMESLNPSRLHPHQSETAWDLLHQPIGWADMTSERKRNNDPIPKKRLCLMTQPKIQDSNKFVLLWVSRDDRLRWRHSFILFFSQQKINCTTRGILPLLATDGIGRPPGAARLQKSLHVSFLHLFPF